MEDITINKIVDAKAAFELKKKAEREIAEILKRLYQDTDLKPTSFHFDYEESCGGGYWVVNPVISLR